MGEPWPRGGADALRPRGMPAFDTMPAPPGVDLAPVALALYAKVLAATTLPAAAHGLVCQAPSAFSRALN